MKSTTSTKTKKKEGDVPASSAEAAMARTQTIKTTRTAASAKAMKVGAATPPAAVGAPTDLTQVDSAFMGDLQRRRLARDAALRKIAAAKEERAKLLVKLDALEAHILMQEDAVERLNGEIKKGEASYAEYLQITAQFLAAVWKKE